MKKLYRDSWEAIKDWVETNEKNKHLPAIAFYQKTTDDQMHIAHAFQIFKNSEWQMLQSYDGTQILCLPVGHALGCFQYNEDRINKDLCRLSGLNTRVRSVLGDVPVTEEIETLIKSIREGINEYKYLTLNKQKDENTRLFI